MQKEGGYPPPSPPCLDTLGEGFKEGVRDFKGKIYTSKLYREILWKERFGKSKGKYLLTTPSAL